MSSEQYIKLFDSKVPPSPEKALPVVTYSDSVSCHLNGDDLVCFHVANAHTDGDAIVEFRNANVVHVGDTFFTISYPVIDLSTGGSINGMIAACARVKKQVKAKKTLEQVQASKLTADIDPKWGQGFIKPDKFVEVVYADLLRK